MTKPSRVRSVRLEDDDYKALQDMSVLPYTASWQVQEAVRQYLAGKAPKKEISPVKKQEKRFTPPTPQEAGNYFLLRGSPDAVNESDKFMDFYASKNWMVGKNKMKDWKAAIRNWMRSSNEKSQRANQPSAKQRVGDAIHGSTANDWG